MTLYACCEASTCFYVLLSGESGYQLLTDAADDADIYVEKVTLLLTAVSLMYFFFNSNHLAERTAKKMAPENHEIMNTISSTIPYRNH